MGDYADMMLDGTLCEGCGVYLGWSTGVPEYCGDCKKDHAPEPATKKVPCPNCGKRVKPAGINDHMRVVHGVTG